MTPGGDGRPLRPGDTIGFAGLGRMGQPMAGRLAAAGYRVVGFDISATARQKWSARTGCECVDDVAGIADGAAAVVLMLPDSAVVASVLTDHGVLKRLERGAVVIDMSSSVPARTRELAATAGARGLSYVDAPVSGGVSGARQGSLTIMVGGAAGAVSRIRGLLEVLGSRVLHVGDSGAGHAVKALNNLLSATHLLVTSEALAAAARFGLDVPTALEAINTSSGRSGSTENKWPNFIVTGSFDSGFALSLMVKDMRIALDLIESTGGESGLAAASVQLWEQAAAALGPGADHTEIARWLDPDSGAGRDA
jgi:3-hydroxyisobutyrate dehydrogenase